MRLRGTISDRPKGLIELDGEPLVARSMRLLRAAEVARITLVVGHLGDQYRVWLSDRHDVDIVENAEYETTGSMASLAIALKRVREDVLVLESDIVYEGRALDRMAESGASATLVSGVTGAGDEVWVHAPEGRLVAMSKQPRELPNAIGEFVGITRLTSSDAASLHDLFGAFVARHGHGRMNYETDALVALARRRTVEVVSLPDLVWGEIDDESQYQRVRSIVWPAIRSQEGV